MVRPWIVVAAGIVALGGTLTVMQAQRPASAERATLDQYCIGCHNERARTADLALDTLDIGDVAHHPDVWERAVRKLRARAMPPAGSRRPSEQEYEQLTAYLETALDRSAATHVNPGRTEAVRRLNRYEYENAIRDVVGVDVDVTELLPPDEASFGFDTVGITSLSPTLMERYLSAAQKISRLAIGSPLGAPASQVVVLPPDLTQEQHVEGLPVGTRGGTAFTHTFPRDGEYLIQVKLARNRNENVEGLTEPHELEILLDGERLHLFTITPNRNRLNQYYADEDVDKGLEVRVPVTAGPHVVAATFLRKNAALLETTQQPYQAHFNQDRHPRTQPGVHSVSIAGPFGPTAAGDTPSRERILICQPWAPADEEPCARTIVRSLARRAYRRPVTDADVAPLVGFYRDGRTGASFEAGIETAVRALLASPEFLLRIERDPADAAPDDVYRISDLELASRLSFFLWSSVPDEALLDAASRNTLGDPATFDREVTRLLHDSRADALVRNFSGQWLQLRNLEVVSPDARTFPDFDRNLRQAMRRETELLFESIVTENRSVVELLDAGYTFLNERLARHYGVPDVYGDHFRRVPLPDGSPRAGLLGHGSILTLTSYATRTSPVLRGKWILENIVGMPPPPPPPNVPALEERASGVRALTMRDRMVQHRANPACAACHQLMDPLGLSMEHFDAVGRWRVRGEGGSPIDASGRLFGGPAFDGVEGLRQALLDRPEVFVTTLTEKLLTYALGRGLESYDQPAVRRIVREAAANDYRMSALVLGVAKSVPFQMRQAGTAVDQTAGGR